jgi:hypothetical protein
VVRIECWMEASSANRRLDAGEEQAAKRFKDES